MTTTLEKHVGEIIHFPGPQMRFGNKARQRCLWCGVIIDEHDYEREAVAIPKGQSAEVTNHEHRQLKWSGLVAIDGNLKYALPEPSDGMAPENSCMMLDL